jgi:hypothetical protein
MKLSLTDRFRHAVLPQNRLATCIGSVVGGAVPCAVYWIVHHEVDATTALYLQPKLYLVLAGLLFSALSVYGVARDVFESWAKSLGFVVLVEGSMSLADSVPLSLSMLAILVVLNAVSASIALSNQQKDARRETRKVRGNSPASSGDVLSIAPRAEPTPKKRAPKVVARTSLTRSVAGGK